MPTVTIGLNTTDDFSGFEDSELTEGSPSSNSASNTDIEVTKFGGGDWRFAILKATGLSNITGPVTVSAATLNVWNHGGNDFTQVVSAYPVLRNWNVSQVTWDSYTTGNAWTTGGGQSVGNDRQASVASTTPAGGYAQWTGAGLIALVQAWINGTQSNYGLILERSDSQNDGKYLQFRSSQHTDGERPFLEVTYTAGGGSSTTVTPTTGGVTLEGRTPSANPFTNVRIRDTLINEAGSPVGSRTGIHLLVWYAGRPVGGPDLSYSAMTSDANGTISWSIATGSLAYNQHIFYVATDGGASLSQYTCARVIPSYE
jgi:hypothetical protein